MPGGVRGGGREAPLYSIMLLGHGLIGDKRFIVGFNPALFAEDRKNRKEKICFFETYLKNENKDLKNAQRDRKLKATEARVLNKLKRLKIKSTMRSQPYIRLLFKDG